MPVAAPRRGADGQQYHIGLGDRRGELRRKAQPARGAVGFDELIEPRLVDRDAPLAQRGDLFRVLIDTNHLMAEIGETGAADQPDIAAADNGDAHGSSPVILRGAIV